MRSWSGGGAHELQKKVLNQRAYRFTHSATVNMSVKARLSCSNSSRIFEESSSTRVSEMLIAKFCIPKVLSC